MYKLLKDYQTKQVFGAIKDSGDGTCTSFIFHPDNTDYATFKAQINADEAQLEDADGNLMTAKKAKEFVATLP